MNPPEGDLYVQPAQLAFLAIYNPTLGPTDESFPEQLVYYYSRAAETARLDAKRRNRDAVARDDVLRAEENERLRQIGLAQGMVNFARSFSNGQSVDSIDTERSRIVLRELEQGWWILASIDLTRIPIVSTAGSEASSKAGLKTKAKPEYEYSSREVSPALLLIQQLLQAHRVFLLHHGASLDELYVRLKREKFTATVERYWSRVSRTWNISLHNNPAVDAFDAIKVNSGGELGFGVGEEEWGSGERNVLEDLVRRTEGMVDLVASRFGDSVPKPPEVGKNLDQEAETVPWMGSGQGPTAMDGVIFSGVGAITRPSLRSLSLWMRQIYTYGEYAYGVHDNPSRERRRRRGHRTADSTPAPDKATEAMHGSRTTGAAINAAKTRRKLVSRQAGVSPGSSNSAATAKNRRPQVEERTSTSGTYSAIPQPIVSAAEQSLNTATRKADEGVQNKVDDNTNNASGTTLGIPDEYMKYLTLGLSTFAKPTGSARPSVTTQKSAASSQTVQAQSRVATSESDDKHDGKIDDVDEPVMTQIEPMPDGANIMDKILKQRRLEGQGHFVVGLKGDLESQSSLAKDDDAASESENDDGSRKVLRTLYIEVNNLEAVNASNGEASHDADLQNLARRRNANYDLQRLRVLVYVHRPFVYCLVFTSQTTSLQYSKLYKDIHHSLGSIHKSLLASTSAVKVSQRVDASQTTHDTTPSSGDDAQSSPYDDQDTTDIYDFLYDPRTLSLHTSIPNIPDPGTPAAEGFVAGRARDAQHIWTRVDAMNVHSHILSTLASVQWHDTELERTSKTSRGWWVVWLKLPLDRTDSPTRRDSTASTASVGKSTLPSGATVPLSSTVTSPRADLHRVAFLVRKATEPKQAVRASVGSRAMAGLFGALSLRSANTEDRTGGVNAGWGPAALAGGIGVDARKYVEGLFSLNR